MTPSAKNIIKYPSPLNANKIIYKNSDGLCYKYIATEVKCTDNTINQPIA